MNFGIHFTPSVSSSHQAAQTAYAQETAQSTDDVAKALSILVEELAKEKQARIAADRKATVMSWATIIIAALTLVATIAVPIMLRH